MSTKQTYSMLMPVTAIFTATLLISNTLCSKIFTIGGITLPAGTIIFPVAYLAGDILTEVYGYAVARRTIWCGFAALILMTAMYQIALYLPPADFWTPNQPAFETIFAQVPRIVAASMSAYFCGEFVNSYILAKIKVRTKGDAMPVRFIASTIFGQFVDTFVFVLVAFAGVLPAGALMPLFLSGWGVKVAWEIIALPVTLPFVRWIKRKEGVDYFDTHTNFSPFRLKDK